MTGNSINEAAVRHFDMSASEKCVSDENKSMKAEFHFAVSESKNDNAV